MSAAIALRGAGLAPWPRHLVALGVAAMAILALFARDAMQMASVWWTSPTFNHCLLIVPIVGWLVWQRLPELRLIEPVAWAPGLALVAAGAGAWLLGEAGSIAVARHFGLVVMLQGAVVACLGKAVFAGLAFPIFYMLFLVPAGDQLVPPLQTLTADMTMALLALTGVPAHIEGVFITTPGGYFEVAEACAGVRFLVAMAAFGALAANLCFRSWRRRAAFMAACLALPILANGVRAWGTIYVAQGAGIEFAAGFDHILYGWLFFGLVIALLVAGAWPWFDRPADAPAFDADELPRGRPAPLAPVAGAAAAIAVAAFFWANLVPAAAVRPVAADFRLPDVPGWQRVAPGEQWRPRFAAPDLYRRARYRDPLGREVDLVLAVYARQREGRELVAYGQGAAAGWAWTADAPPPPGGRAERIASHGLVRDTLIFYRVGDRLTGSAIAVKLATMRARLLGGPQRAAVLMVSAPAPAAGVGARPGLDDFLAALGPVAPLADRAAGLD